MDRTEPISYPTFRPSFLLLFLVGKRHFPARKGLPGGKETSGQTARVFFPGPPTLAMPPFDPPGPRTWSGAAWPHATARRRRSKRWRGCCAGEPRPPAFARTGRRNNSAVRHGRAKEPSLLSIVGRNDNVVKTCRRGSLRSARSGARRCVRQRFVAGPTPACYPCGTPLMPVVGPAQPTDLRDCRGAAGPVDSRSTSFDSRT